MKTLPQKTGWDIGVCLRNIDTFMTTSAVFIKHGLSRYIYNVDIRLLAENPLLTRNLPAWESFCGERNPTATEGVDSLCQSVLSMANDLSADPSVSMATWEGSEDDLYAEEDQDLEATKLSFVSRANQ